MLKSAPKKDKKDRDPEGRMPLAEHLRELRNRLAKSVLAIVVASVVSAFFYNDIINLITKPVLQSVGCNLSFGELAQKQGGETCARIVMMDLLGPFTLALKVSLMAGLILSAPVWLYQLWAFLAPGLHRSEKKYALSFVAAGFPLFMIGGYFAYAVLPTTAKVLIDFTPIGIDNLLPLDKLLDLVTRMVVVFGLSFEMPLLLVLLNFGGVISGKRMLGWWRAMIMGITLFSAIATPSTDPLTMIALAAPIVVLYFAAVLVSLVNDGRRARAVAAGPADDEASELDLTPDDIGAIESVDAPRALPEQSGSGRALESRREDMDDIT
ncbi:twin-arginine translocase subunit TatC [Streptomyces purpurogeneiscleroticus]|uniref:twin-arginine translocase subunit TatC n=1 Tax=Streptomyces purpurogeneiscleroticus TaxID=68259 RepID=UPI001CC09AB2|nr:twin-arginine translocase subunit TatC [Streptomyces purpurogeneiscleroticus]MBZ4016439.1 twin-arginine translocase subunit TatC [Streptomyces purpurogeneiscleroticus]